MHIRSQIVACCTAGSLALTAAAIVADDDDNNGSAFRFNSLPASAACVPGGAGTFPHEEPFLLPPGFSQIVVAREGDGGSTDNWDMHTLNETGRNAGRFLYHTHETLTNGQITVTDLVTNTTRVLIERVDWNRIDGIVWTPWRTLLTGEEMRPERQPSLPDPQFPLAQAGLMYEVNPTTGKATVLPALGARAHEGMRFDSRGNIYGISETAPTTVVGTPPRAAPGGYIFKFTPDRYGDLSSGQLYALKIVRDAGDRTGDAIWLPLDRDAVQIDADVAATAAGATGYARPEDVETATSTGIDRNPGENLYVAVTDEHRVLKIMLNGRRPGDDDDDDDDDGDDNGRRGRRRDSRRAFVTDYVRQGVNAPADFTNPDNLALDRAGNLFITEDTVTPPGMDVWMAPPSRRNPNTAGRLKRFASLTDCTAEPSGAYFDLTGRAMYIHTLHRAGMDLSVRITQDRRRRD